MSFRRPHLIVLVGVVLAGVVSAAAPALAAAAVPGSQPHRFEPKIPKSSCTPSGHSGAPVDQATVLARAQVWVAQNVNYTQTCGHDPGGYYREDCSGFVSMAWALNTSLSTWNFNPAYNGGDPRFRPVAQGALVPGDAVVADNSTADHIALFTGWGSNDHGLHRYANLSEESDFGVGTIAVTNQDLDGSYWGTFTPIHYTNMTTSTLSASSGSSVFVSAEAADHVFWTSPDGHLMQTWQSGQSAGAWRTQDLGGVVSGEPSVTQFSGRYDVFAVSPTGHLYQRTYSSSWGPWLDLGPSWTPGVAAVYVPASDQFHVFGHDPSGHLQEYSGNKSWQRDDVGGVTAGTPGVSVRDGRIDVFAVSPTGRLFQRTFAGAWGGWTSIADGPYGPGAAAVYTGTAYHVFARSLDDHMMQMYTTSTGWQGPQDLGGIFSRAPGVTYHDGRYDLFGPTSEALYESSYTVHWSSWTKVSAT